MKAAVNKKHIIQLLTVILGTGILLAVLNLDKPLSKRLVLAVAVTDLCILVVWLLSFVGKKTAACKLTENRKGFVRFSVSVVFLLLYILLYIVILYGLGRVFGVVKLLCAEVMLSIFIVSFIGIVFCRLSPEKLYPVIAMAAGILFLFVIPAQTVPDEPTHYASAYYLSNMLLGIPNGEDGSVVMRRTDAERVMPKYGYNLDDKMDVYENYWNSITDAPGDEELIVTAERGVSKARFQYIAGALGLSVGRLLHLGTAAAFLMGRLFQLIFFVFLMSLSMKLLPFGKMVFFVIGLLPMTLQQAASFSYDVFVNGISALLTALCLALAFDRDISNRRGWIMTGLAAVCSILIVTVKSGAYVPFALLPLIPAVRIAGEKKNRKLSAALAASVLLALAVFAVPHITGGLVAGHAVTSENRETAESAASSVNPETGSDESAEEKTENVTGNWIEWADEPGYTISYLLQHPKLCLELIRGTLKWNAEYYVSTFVGRKLGWTDRDISALYVYPFLLLLLLSVLLRKNEPVLITNFERVMFLAISLSSVALTFVGMLIAWTPLSSTTILGVQGRYFIPCAMLGCLAFRSDRITADKTVDAGIAMGCVFLLFFVFQTIL